PKGELMVSVPDFAVLADLFVNSIGQTADDRGQLLHMVFGGQLDQYDVHKSGLTYEFLGGYVHEAGFINIQRMSNFGLFRDSSILEFDGIPISVNLKAVKP